MPRLGYLSFIEDERLPVDGILVALNANRHAQYIRIKRQCREFFLPHWAFGNTRHGPHESL